MQRKYSLAAGAAYVAAALTAGLINVSARATSIDGIPSAGEASPLLVCFYECKRNFDSTAYHDDDFTTNHDDDDDDDDDDDGGGRIGDGYWKEVTLLVLANQRNATLTGLWDLYDGNQAEPDGPIYGEPIVLSGQDLDEINVCRRLDRELRPLPVPEAGTIAIELSDTGGYAWVKNVLGEINRFAEDPFNSPVRDVAKTECRVVPAEGSTLPPTSECPCGDPFLFIESDDDWGNINAMGVATCTADSNGVELNDMMGAGQDTYLQATSNPTNSCNWHDDEKSEDDDVSETGLTVEQLAACNAAVLDYAQYLVDQGFDVVDDGCGLNFP
jgi:hypothetical protein